MNRPLAMLLALTLTPALAAAPRRDGAQLLHALERMRVVGTVLYVAAHPDDENTRLLASFANAARYRTAYLSFTRGEGGQNLIGPELGPLLGVIRTQELLAARRVDGAEQYFTRARDFGYSKSVEETLATWEHDAVLADAVHVIRTLRPDLVITRFAQEAGETHGHHTASARLALEAFRAAADPAFAPGGLPPWQARRILWNAWNPDPDEPKLPAGTVQWDSSLFNPLLGLSFGELAAESRSMHKSQGFGAAPVHGSNLENFVPLAGEPMKSSPFDGIDASWKRVPGAEKLDALLARAVTEFRVQEPSRSVPTLLLALETLRALPENPWKTYKLEQLSELISDCAGLFVDATTAGFRVVPGGTLEVTATALNRTQTALRLEAIEVLGAAPSPSAQAQGDAANPQGANATSRTAAGPELVASAKALPSAPPTAGAEPVASTKAPPSAPPAAGAEPAAATKAPPSTATGAELGAAAKAPSSAPPLAGAAPVAAEKAAAGMTGSAGAWRVLASVTPALALERGKASTTKLSTAVPADTRTSTPYWLEQPPQKGVWTLAPGEPIGAAQLPPTFAVRFQLSAGTQRLTLTRAVTFTWVDPTVGERARPVEVLPAVLVKPQAPLLAFTDLQPRALTVTVTANAEQQRGELHLEGAEGFTVTPARAPFSLAAVGAQAELTFTLTPRANAPVRTQVTAVATVGEASYARGLTRIEYGHIPIQTVLPPAQVQLMRVDLKRGKTSTIGYVVGAGDEVPAALRQVGYQVTLLSDEALRTAPLRGYDAIVVGIRAYNTNPTLAAAYDRLMQYVREGGTLVAQYNTRNWLSKVPAQLGPFPFEVSQGRVTDEEAAVTLAKHPALEAPNRITAQDFEGWVQERGLYFGAKWDSAYQTPLSMHDAGEPDAQGSLLIARLGKGRFVYTGLSFFRQLPAGVPGAYRLFANLVAVGP